MMYTILLGTVLFLLYVDLEVLNKKDTRPTSKQTTIEAFYWITLSIAFSGIIYWAYSGQIVDNPNQLTPTEATIKYLTGYLIELSLSVDNLFVIALVFSSLGVPVQYQHRVLFWGIVGAMVFRAALIFPGVLLINTVGWVTYVFGASLIFTALRLLNKKDTTTSKRATWISKLVPVTRNYQGERFWIVEEGVRKATPLLTALIIIELTDVLFALDSIPAIFAITTDPLIVFSSNIFAVLGLRALYFFLVDMLEQFYYIKYSVVAILLFVGVKMMIIHQVHLPEWLSLIFIVVTMGLGMLLSMVYNPSTNQEF